MAIDKILRKMFIQEVYFHSCLILHWSFKNCHNYFIMHIVIIIIDLPATNLTLRATSSGLNSTEGQFWFIIKWDSGGEQVVHSHN